MEKQLEDLLPPNIIEYAFKNHMRIKLGSMDPDTAAMYHNESDDIVLNPDLDIEAMAKRLSSSWGTKVEPEACHIALFFHEEGHWKQRTNYGEVDLKTALARKQENEIRADDFAIRKFWDWKLNSWEQFHYRKWLREKVP